MTCSPGGTDLRALGGSAKHTYFSGKAFDQAVKRFGKEVKDPRNPLSNWLRLTKKLKSGSYGVTYMADIADVPNAVVVKVNMDDDNSDELAQEYRIQQYLNLLRPLCPNFALAYAIFECPLLGNASYVWDEPSQEVVPIQLANHLIKNGTMKKEDFQPLKIAPLCERDQAMEALLIDYISDEGLPNVNYLAIELVETSPGKTSTFFEYVTKASLLDISELLSRIIQIALGLQTAQDKFRLAHNDLHLSNILLQGLHPLLGLLPAASTSGVNVYYPEYGMTVYTSMIPVIIDFGKARMDVPVELQSALQQGLDTQVELEKKKPASASASASVFQNIMNTFRKSTPAPTTHKDTILVLATNELIEDVSYGGYVGFTYKFNSANDIFMVVCQIWNHFRNRKQNPFDALVDEMLGRKPDAGLRAMREDQFTYKFFQANRKHVIVSDFGDQYRLPVIPGPNFEKDVTDHTVQDLNGMRPIDVVKYIEKLYPKEYAKITQNRTAIQIPIEELQIKYQNLSCV